MKRIFIIIVLVVSSISLFAQTSSGVWNSNTATYTNSAHKITWQLLDEFTWVGRPILTDNTLLKVRNDDTHILVTLGVGQDEVEEGDPWDYISQYESAQMIQLKKLQAQQNGMTFIGTKAVKSQLCGIHAIKTRTDMKKYYPEYDQTVHSIEIMYQLLNNARMYTITVTALSVLEEEIDIFDRLAVQLFNGFSIK